jgi:ATP-dependent DNA helicase RecQ
VKPVKKAPKPAAAPTPAVAPVLLTPARFDSAAFGTHDEAAEAALRQCKAAWLSEADSERARDRFCEAAERSKRPALLIGASPALWVRERARLAKLGFKALHLDCAEGRVARSDLEALRRGGSLLVLVTADVLGRAEVQSALSRVEFGSVGIDAAELASEKSNEFRPAFARLSQLLSGIPAASLFALARPVPAEVRRDAQERLGLARAALVEAPLVAPGLRLDVRSVRGERRNPTLLSLLPELPERGVIVCATPHEVDAVCAVIGAEHGSVCRIHAAMPPADRAAMRDRFALANGRALLVTTSALAPDVGLPGLGETTASEPRVGFGFDALTEDVGFVLHHHAPASLEQYLREVSTLRAPEALALLFYDSSHRSMNQAVLEQQRLPALKLEPLTRALEGALASGKPVKHEALAFQIGVSRRTSERFIALLVDAGVARREAGIALQYTGLELAKHSSELARALETLQRGDSGRLASVERYAESADCKRRVLGHYFGEAATATCGRCAACRSVGGVERKSQAR